MNAQSAKDRVEDFASVSIDLKLAEKHVYANICELQRLFRINPHLEIKSWQEEEQGNLYAGKKIRVEFLNEMNGLLQNMTLTVSAVQPGKSLCIDYESGLKQSTHISVEALDRASSRLTIKEIYPADLSVEDKEARINEVDKSLVPWGEGIHSYFARQKRWRWFPFSNWLQGNFWLGMTPRHRRVTRLIIWTTVLEFVVFLFVFVIYWLELGRAKG